MDANFFEQIQFSCHEQEIVGLCEKLAKRCSYDILMDVRRLCRLAYWLFVYEHDVEAIVICRETHEVRFPGNGQIRIWDYILAIWGLEVYLLKKQEEWMEAQIRIQKMDQIWMLRSENRAKEEKRRSCFTSERVMGIDTIAKCDNQKDEKHYRFIALFRMIGYGSTGLFPDLVRHQEMLNQAIDQYVTFLKVSDKS